LKDKPLHILFLCSWYPNPDDASNGIFIKRHAEAIALKHQVTIIFAKSIQNITEETLTICESGNLKEITFFYPKNNSKVPLISSISKLYKFKQVYKKLINDLGDQSFDIIHLNTIFPGAIAASYAIRRFPKAKLVITEHWSGYYPEDGNYKGFFLKRATQKIIEKAKAILVISNKLKKDMLSQGLKGNYYLINNVVDTTVFKPIQIAEHNKTEKLKLLHVSSLVNREKNIVGIIDIIEKLVSRNILCELTIVGKNEQELNNYLTIINEKKLGINILFVGYKNAEEITEYMNLADVFLLWSHFEGMPVVLLEALSCGLPVISSNVGQVKQMIPNNMGFVFEKDETEKCIDVLSNFKSHTFATKTEMHLYIKNNYSKEAVCDSISNIYQQLITNA